MCSEIITEINRADAIHRRIETQIHHSTNKYRTNSLRARLNVIECRLNFLHTLRRTLAA